MLECQRYRAVLASAARDQAHAADEVGRLAPESVNLEDMPAYMWVGKEEARRLIETSRGGVGARGISASRLRATSHRLTSSLLRFARLPFAPRRSDFSPG